MDHPKTLEWESRLRSMFVEIDEEIERIYGSFYPLHPNRPGHGETSSREMDGLFNIGADFSPGYGSRFGRGYVVRIRLSTLAQVSEDIRLRIRNDVLKMVRERLPVSFPERRLQVKMDGNLLKIIGDFGLGRLE